MGRAFQYELLKCCIIYRTLLEPVQNVYYMITEQQNSALKIVAQAASKNPKYKSYMEYCLDRERGLRKQAFVKLRKFIDSTDTWALNEKINFVKFLVPFFENVEDADYGPFPEMLSDRLVKPVLKKWCNDERVSSEPFRWYGKYYKSEEHILKALKLNPKDDLARSVLLKWWTYEIYWSIHHLPDGYIGKPEDDIKLAKKVAVHIDLLVDRDLKLFWNKELEEDLEIVENYIAWKESGHPSLEKWGKENMKTVSYNITRVYYQRSK